MVCFTSFGTLGKVHMNDCTGQGAVPRQTQGEGSAFALEAHIQEVLCLTIPYAG